MALSSLHHSHDHTVNIETVQYRLQAAKAADVYSYGVLLWELGHGRTAWEQLLRV